MHDPMMVDKLANILHTLTCQKEHAQSMEELIYEKQNPDLCYFYLENTLVPEDRVTHKKWEELALELCNNYDMTPEDVLRALPILLECRQKIEGILAKAPNAVELCRLVVFSEL